MVINSQINSKIRSSYYLEPGKTLNNTKISERKLLLMAPRSEYNRFVDYNNEKERMAIIAVKENAKLSAARKATYEMSKNWENTNENVKKRREEELLAKRKNEDEIRDKFAIEIGEKNSAARASIVREARRLLLQRKPQCRLLNGAFLTSECFRERDAQLAFEKTLKGIDEEREKKYADEIEKDVETFEENERRNVLAKFESNKAFGMELKKQIEGNKNDIERARREEYILGKKDLENMARDLKMMKELEEEQTLNRRNELKKLVTDAIEEKKNVEIELKKENEFQERALEIFERSKKRIQNIKKLKTQEESEAKIRSAEYLVKKFGVRTTKKLIDDENLSIVKAQREIEAKESAIIEAKKRRALDVRMERIKIHEETEKDKRKKEIEIKEFNNWETLQRLKRVEFNKEFERNERIRELEVKIAIAKDLRKQMLDNEEKKIREKKYEYDENSVENIIEITNKKVLDYGEEILNESIGVRPLFPILKTIEKFKIENRLIPRQIRCGDNDATPGSLIRKPKKRTPVCLAPVPEQEIIYI